MSSISAMNVAASALTTYGDGMNVHTHNVANVNTDGFTPQRVVYRSGPQDQGVRLDISAPAAKAADDAAANDLAARAAALAAGEPPVPSGTDVATEFTHMIVTENAHAANAATVRTVDEITGYLLDMKL